jgi:hypothetical protein
VLKGMPAAVEANGHEHIPRAMYYLSIHLLYASIVGCAAWLLTSIRGASATAKYWTWFATAFNFTLPIGAAVDRMWGSHLTWATPLGLIGGTIWDITQGRTAQLLAGLWTMRRPINADETHFTHTQVTS